MTGDPGVCTYRNRGTAGLYRGHSEYNYGSYYLGLQLVASSATFHLPTHYWMKYCLIYTLICEQ